MVLKRERDFEKEFLHTRLWFYITVNRRQITTPTSHCTNLMFEIHTLLMVQPLLLLAGVNFLSSPFCKLVYFYPFHPQGKVQIAVAIFFTHTLTHTTAVIMTAFIKCVCFQFILSQTADSAQPLFAVLAQSTFITLIFK